jgi:hypothetical protein
MSTPSNRIEELLALVRGPWRTRDWERVSDLALELPAIAPDTIVPFALASIGEALDVGPLLDALLSIVTAQQWPELVARAVAAVRENSKNPAAVRVLDDACLRVPTAVHPYLETIVDLQPGHHNLAAFRETHWQHVAFLTDRFFATPAEHRRPIAVRLLETRLPEAFVFVKSHEPHYPEYLPQVGYTETPEGLRPLYVERPHHFAFEPEYLPVVIGTIDRLRALNPTWVPTGSGAARYRLGGIGTAACGSCGGFLHHLITFDPVPEGIGVTGLERLELATCFSCLGWEQERLAYVHDSSGTPHDVGHTEELCVPQFPASALRETVISLIDLGPLWRWQEWGAANDRENLFRVGGQPSWIQCADYPTCAHCGHISHFLLQLDSELPVSGEEPLAGGWSWGESGICYIFWCDACKVSTMSWQCT